MWPEFLACGLCGVIVAIAWMWFYRSLVQILDLASSPGILDLADEVLEYFQQNPDRVGVIRKFFALGAALILRVVAPGKRAITGTLHVGGVSCVSLVTSPCTGWSVIDLIRATAELVESARSQD